MKFNKLIIGFIVPCTGLPYFHHKFTVSAPAQSYVSFQNQEKNSMNPHKLHQWFKNQASHPNWNHGGYVRIPGQSHNNEIQINNYNINPPSENENKNKPIDISNRFDTYNLNDQKEIETKRDVSTKNYNSEHTELKNSPKSFEFNYDLQSIFNLINGDNLDKKNNGQFYEKIENTYELTPQNNQIHEKLENYYYLKPQSSQIYEKPENNYLSNPQKNQIYDKPENNFQSNYQNNQIYEKPENDYQTNPQNNRSYKGNPDYIKGQCLDNSNDPYDKDYKSCHHHDTETIELNQDMIIEMVNKLRYQVSSQLPILKYRQDLFNIAQNHSDSMASCLNHNHHVVGNENFKTRIKRSATKNVASAENVGWYCSPYPSKSGKDQMELELTEVYNGWEESDGHYNNMIKPDVNYIAVARHGAFWTMILSG